MYRAFGLLKPDTDFSFDSAESLLKDKFPGFEVTREPTQIVVGKGEWWIALALITGPEIQMEIEGLVGRVAGIEPSEAAVLAEAEKRLELWTDVPDPFMEHFNDYLIVVEALKSFSGILVIDPKEPSLL